METFQVYRDIQARTGGEIYMGVVDPVGTGKSTFIRRFVELVALPSMKEKKRAEAQTISELKKQGKPFLVLVNSQAPYGDKARNLARELKEKYQVTTLTANCEQLREEDVSRILEHILYEFPVSEIQFYIPKWVEMLPMVHELKQELLSQIKDCMKQLSHLRDIKKETLCLTGSYVQETHLEEISLATEVVRVRIEISIFGKSIEELVEDGIKSKITAISEESQMKFQDTMEKNVNDSKGGLVCIII